jgi:polar amino acid transport system substrate-binding protein
MKYIYIVLSILSFSIINGCSEHKNLNEIHFATFSEYPPFEYSDHGELVGFDIDLAKMVAKQLGKTAVFDNLPFSTILPAIASGQVDAAIAAITITPDRQKNLDFTTPYYFEGMAVVYQTSQPIHTIPQLTGNKIAAQLGSTMDFWLHKQIDADHITTFPQSNQAIEALLSGHVDAVLIDSAQAAVYSHKHPELSFSAITKAEEGYGIALKKNSPLTLSMNQVLKKLASQGEIEKLKTKWLAGGASWNH